MTFLASPFIVLAMTMYLVLKHAEKILRRPAYATERRWNDLAKWKFRWFNEMEEAFDVRKETSYAHADKYVEQFGSELLGLLARFLTFVSGSLAGLLLVISALSWWLLAAWGAGGLGAQVGGAVYVSEADCLSIPCPDCRRRPPNAIAMAAATASASASAVATAAPPPPPTDPTDRRSADALFLANLRKSAVVLESRDSAALATAAAAL